MYRKTAVREGRAKASALRKNRKQKFLELFGEASDDDDLSSTYVKASSKPSDSAISRANKKESGFPREWRLTEIDVDVQHRRREKMTGPSGELYKSLFSVDPFQLEDFDAEWESFVSREVSCGTPTSPSENTSFLTPCHCVLLCSLEFVIFKVLRAFR